MSCICRMIIFWRCQMMTIPRPKVEVPLKQQPHHARYSHFYQAGFLLYNANNWPEINIARRVTCVSLRAKLHRHIAFAHCAIICRACWGHFSISLGEQDLHIDVLLFMMLCISENGWYHLSHNLAFQDFPLCLKRRHLTAQHGNDCRILHFRWLESIPISKLDFDHKILYVSLTKKTQMLCRLYTMCSPAGYLGNSLVAGQSLSLPSWPQLSAISKTILLCLVTFCCKASGMLEQNHRSLLCASSMHTLLCYFSLDVSGWVIRTLSAALNAVICDLGGLMWFLFCLLTCPALTDVAFPNWLVSHLQHLDVNSKDRHHLSWWQTWGWLSGFQVLGIRLKSIWS